MICLSENIRAEIPSRPVLLLYVRVQQPQVHIDQVPSVGWVRFLDSYKTAGAGFSPLA